jgi:hypothetical protein
MSITIPYETLDALSRRNASAPPSAQLKAVVNALRTHQTEDRSMKSIERLKKALEDWQAANPKEVAACSTNSNDVVARLANDVVSEHMFCKQFEIAADIASKVLAARGEYIVNEADTSDANRGALATSHVDNLKTVLKPDVSPKDMLAALGIRNRSHWETKGAAVAANPTMAIRCGESAALAVHMLRKDKRFVLPLSIIEQGNGMIDGHFWVVAGIITGSGEPHYGIDTFTVDLWGMATDHTDSPLCAPAARPFDMRNNKIRTLVSWKPGHPDGVDED